MPFEYKKFITRTDLRKNPNKIFVFGDNMARSGYGGQAKEMRGELNSFGIPTKWLPSNSHHAFFSDDDFEKIVPHLEAAHSTLSMFHLAGLTIVWPEDGIGTGLAELDKRAPMIFAYIKKIESHLRDDIDIL